MFVFIITLMSVLHVLLHFGTFKHRHIDIEIVRQLRRSKWSLEVSVRVSVSRLIASNCEPWELEKADWKQTPSGVFLYARSLAFAAAFCQIVDECWDFVVCWRTTKVSFFRTDYGQSISVWSFQHHLMAPSPLLCGPICVGGHFLAPPSR